MIRNHILVAVVKSGPLPLKKVDSLKHAGEPVKSNDVLNVLLLSKPLQRYLKLFILVCTPAKLLGSIVA